MGTVALNFLIALVWGAAGFWLRQNTKLSVVEVSALLALTAGLVLPPLFTEGALFALTCTAVSYAAMCSGERCCSYKDMLTISGVCSLVIYFGQSVLTGIGGRLGTSAAISVLLCLLVRNVLNLDKAQKAAKS
ncbi:MAG: hypothetical protein ACOX46_10590 [Limnochordia bacterium]|jgi:hypothetical protein|nr:hypothetical protein [Bacillota bacterium]NLL09158.1 hypothetical protein [Bacillota bacterium]HBG10499.1 hypothetical protein [Bacillota bacterium]